MFGGVSSSSAGASAGDSASAPFFRSLPSSALSAAYASTANNNWLNYHVDIASSKWREPISLRGLRESISENAAAAAASAAPGIKRGAAAASMQLRDATCMSLHNELNFSVQGSLDGELQIIKVLPAANESQVDYKCLLRGEAPGPVHSVSFHGDNLLIGSSEGKVHHCRIEMTQLKTARTEIDVKDLDFVEFCHPKFRNGAASITQATPSPEQWSLSDRVLSVGLNRFLPEFYALENNRLHIWNLERTEQPINTIKGSNTPLLCAQWNPHSPNEIIIGGTSKGIKLLDLRALTDAEGGQGAGSDVVKWKRDNAHLDSIRDIKWNPMIPYWVATCGNDALIHVWDLRYNSAEPIVTLAGHDNIVRSVSWSIHHCEMLASGSIDQTVKLWSLKVEPHHVLATIQGLFSDGITNVEFSAYKPQQCVAMSASGEIVTCTLSPSFLTPLVSTHFSENDEDEKEIEKMIYLRQLPKAYQMIAEKAKSYKSQNKLDKALSLLELVKERNMSKGSKVGDPKLRFQRELQEFSYYIPPNLISGNSQVPQERIREIDNLILNCQILNFVQRNEFSEIAQLEQRIVQLLDEDIRCIEVSTMQEVMELFLAHDYGMGMSFLIEVTRTFYLKNEYTLFESVPRKLLAPTMFEATQNPTLQESAFRGLNKVMQDPENVLQQLVVQRDVVSALLNGGSDSAQRIVDIFEHNVPHMLSSGYLDVLSVTAVRIYLNALLAQQRYDRFFIVATNIMQKIQGYDFSFTLREFMEKVAYPELSKMLNEKLQVDLDSLDDKDTLDFLRDIKPVIVQSMCIVSYCPFVPEYMYTSISKTLSHLEHILPICMSRVGEMAQGEREVTNYVRDLLLRLDSESRAEDHQGMSSSAAESSGDAISPLTSQLNKLRSMLQHWMDNGVSSPVSARPGRGQRQYGNTSSSVSRR